MLSQGIERSVIGWHIQVDTPRGPACRRAPFFPNLSGGCRCYLMSGGKPIGSHTMLAGSSPEIGHFRTVLETIRLSQVVLVVAALAFCLPAPTAEAIGPPSGTMVVAAAAAPPVVQVHGPVTTSPKRDWVDYLQIAVVLAAFATALLIGAQLASAARAARQERAAELARLWTARDFRASVSRALAFMDTKTAEECTRKLKEWVRADHSEQPCLSLDNDTSLQLTRNDILFILGAVEDLALRYNGREVARRWVALTLGANLIGMLQRCLWLVWFLRGYYAEPTLSYEWVGAVVDLRGRSPRWPRPSHFVGDAMAAIHALRWRHPAHPVIDELKKAVADQPIRVVCLPPTAGTAPDEDWTSASRLCAALAHQQAQRALIDALPVRSRKEPESSGWRIIVVPSSVDVMAQTESSKYRDDLSRQLNDRVNALTREEVDRELTA